MAHELDLRNDGKARMMYVGKVPWHGLGVALDSPATAEEAIVFGQLDWPVVKESIYLESGITVPDKYATVRYIKDKVDGKIVTLQQVLGVVGKNYEILQNKDAFGFFDAIVADKKTAMYHTAGSLRGGSQIWLLVKLPKNIKVGKQHIEQYVLLTNSHDGTSVVKARFTLIKVVCANTLRAALGTKDVFEVRIKHTGQMKDKLAEAHKVMGIVSETSNETEELYNALAKVKISDGIAVNMFGELVPDKKDAKHNTRSENIRSGLVQLYEDSNEIDKDTAGTVWNWYNAVTSYVSHNRGTRGKDDLARSDNKFHGLMFGTGEQMNKEALAMATNAIN